MIRRIACLLLAFLGGVGALVVAPSADAHAAPNRYPGLKVIDLRRDGNQVVLHLEVQLPRFAPAPTERVFDLRFPPLVTNPR